MKALSLTQPWASLVALGHKRVETRSWTTKYRGPLYIHASKLFPLFAREFATDENAMGRVPDRLPLAGIVATARLVAVHPTEEAELLVSALERHLGDYGPDRFGWFLEDVVALPTSVPCKGALGLWSVPDEIVRAVNASLGVPI